MSVSCASRGAALHIYIACTALLPEMFNGAVQKCFCAKHFFFFFSGMLFVETEALPQKCAESPGNSPGGRRKTALTQRAGTSTGAHPRGSGLPLGLVWNQSISPIPGVPPTTDAHKQVDGSSAINFMAALRVLLFRCSAQLPASLPRPGQGVQHSVGQVQEAQRSAGLDQELSALLFNLLKPRGTQRCFRIKFSSNSDKIQGSIWVREGFFNRA